MRRQSWADSVADIQSHVTLPGCVYIGVTTTLAANTKQITSALPPHGLPIVVPRNVAASGDPISSNTYMLYERAGLRNPALCDPAPGEGQLGFWGASTTRLLASARLLRLLPLHRHGHRS